MPLHVVDCFGSSLTAGITADVGGFSFPDLNQAGLLYLVLGGCAFSAFLLPFPVAAKLCLVSVVGLGWDAFLLHPCSSQLLLNGGGAYTQDAFLPLPQEQRVFAAIPPLAAMDLCLCSIL